MCVCVTHLSVLLSVFGGVSHSAHAGGTAAGAVVISRGGHLLQKSFKAPAAGEIITLNHLSVCLPNVGLCFKDSKDKIYQISSLS